MSDSPQAQQRRHELLVDALRNPASYPHPVGAIEVIETHISTVLLTGRFAYKIKKPVDLGFLDFSSPARRKLFCEEEIRLNRRYAADIYLDVVGFTGSPQSPSMRVGADGFEYAVRMRQFEQACLLSNLLEAGRLSADHAAAIAEELADFHCNGAARCDPDAGYGVAARVLAPMLENFSQLATLPLDEPLRERLPPLARWTRERHVQLAGELERRLGEGFVRECHGDLHLGNIALIGERITFFDGIEFSTQLRWIDTASELAFLVMDLVSQGLEAHAWRLLNRYLELTGDYGALAVHDFYAVYRALVRAKVHAIRNAQTTAGSESLMPRIGDYLTAAERFASARTPRLYITHGVSGSGKSFVAQRLAEQRGLVRLRSDVERKRLFGIPAEASSGSGIGTGIYSPEAGERVYDLLRGLARRCLCAGYPVIVDASFLQRSQRNAFRRLAEELQVPLTLLDIGAPEGVLRARLAARARDSGEVSEAGPDVLERQLRTRQPLDEAELAASVRVANGTAGEPLLAFD